MIKGSIQEEDITIVKIYAPNIGAPQYIRQMLTAIKGEIDSNTIIVGDFNTPLSPVDRSSKMKINKETQASNDTLNKMDLIAIYRTFHPKTTEYTFFSSTHGTFSRIDHILGHKSSLGKFKKIEIISSIFSDHNAMRLDINYEKKSIKNTDTWRLNNTLLNNQEITEAIKEEFKKYLEGFPGGAVVESLPADEAGAGSGPGLGGSCVPRSDWARGPQLLGLRVWSLCSAAVEAAMVRGLRTAVKGGPRLPQLGRALAQRRRPSTAKNK